MAQVAKTAQEQLERVKNNVENARLYFKDNVDRFHKFKTYVFKENIDYSQRAALQEIDRPILEANILEAYLNRLLGEFAKHEPSINVSPAEGKPVNQEVIDLVEGNIRHKIYQANKDGFSTQIFKDTLGGGYSVGKVWTDYQSPMSFHQDIYWGRVFEPTLTGFDPLARAPHKGDGNYSFEIYALPEEEFKRDYGNNKIPYASSSSHIDGFTWCYKDSQNRKIILICDYYEKKRKKTKIVRLANGRVLRMRDYEKLQEYWEAEGFIEQLPVIVGKPRFTMLESIVRYKFTAAEVLEYYETDYSYLPHVFFDGNSVNLTHGDSSQHYQMTRPYVYHAKGTQDLKNYAMIALANHLENIIQHKFILKKEAIPQEEDYIDALTNIQKANTVVVNAYSENNPDKPIPDPIREVINHPAPPEVMATFQVTDPTTQTILGSFASNLGQNDKYLSGKAVVESSTVGNAAAMPYIVNYLAGLQQMATIHVDLMPKYMLGARVIPVVNLAGERTYQGINGIGEVRLDYDEKALHVEVEAGVNFQVQKNQAVEQIIALMQASPALGDFFNDEDGGLPILAKNLTIYGADELPEAIKRWAQKKQMMQAQAQQAQMQAMQNNPQMIRAQADSMRAQANFMKTQDDMEQQQIENQFEIARIANESKKADAEVIKAEAEATNEQIESAVQLEKAQTSLETHALESATKLAEIQSRMHHDDLANRQLEHDIKKAETEITEDE